MNTYLVLQGPNTMNQEEILSHKGFVMVCGGPERGQSQWWKQGYSKGSAQTLMLIPAVMEVSPTEKLPLSYESGPIEARCICDLDPTTATIDEKMTVTGHFNQANEYCCPHYGNTCGFCMQYNS